MRVALVDPRGDFARSTDFGHCALHLPLERSDAKAHATLCDLELACGLSC